MTSNTSPSTHPFATHPAIHLAKEDTATESPTIEHVLAELMFELAVRDMSRRNDSRQPRSRMR